MFRTRTNPQFHMVLAALPRRVRRALVIVVDLMICCSALWLLLSLRFGELYRPVQPDTAILLAIAPLLTIGIFAYGGIYKLVTRYITLHGTQSIAKLALLSGLAWALLVLFTDQAGIPRSVLLAYGPVTALLVIAFRLGAAALLLSARGKTHMLASWHLQRNVIIYGAGPSGVLLATELMRGVDLRPIAFVDPRPSLWGQYIHGLKVHRPDRLTALATGLDIEEVIVAFDEATRDDIRAAVVLLESLAIKFRIFPELKDIASGRLSVNHLRRLEATDLLTRPPVKPEKDLLTRAARGKSILVTGAGGSIGSELVRQLVRLEPRRLILLDASEPSLYAVGEEVQTALAKLPRQVSRPDIVCVLGSVLDAQLLAKLFKDNVVHTVYHAAAYKHVPIVEQNPLVALANNTIGTHTLIAAATVAGVERLVFISTDKAVRPTSVMGASKRMAELVLQAKSAEVADDVFGPVLTAVRFGNVLDSSGSVVRKFREQIRAGGPVTVTHPEVTRFFMSVEEAAELVIQAGEMAKGGEVFLLDMGEQVKIDDLARLMIRGCGLEVRSAEQSNGDIAIEYVGLRPGEKLYEELLIGDGAEITAHPRILKSKEPCFPLQRIEREIKALEAAINASDIDAALAVLRRSVEDYKPQGSSRLLSSDLETAQPWMIH